MPDTTTDTTAAVVNSPANARSGWLAALLLAAVVGANVLLTGSDGKSALAAYLITLLAIVGILGCIGRGVNGMLAGVVIDNRNRISLSKTQAVAWTVLIFSAVAVGAALRLNHGLGATALNIAIPNDLLAVMGLSAVSLVGTPAVLSLKPNGGDGAPAGAVHQNAGPGDASWSDIFQGDDVTNADSVDLSKVQHVLITTLLLVYYAIVLATWLSQTSDPLSAKPSLPLFGTQMVWLLGISHAGYLGYKAVPHTNSG